MIVCASAFRNASAMASRYCSGTKIRRTPVQR